MLRSDKSITPSEEKKSQINSISRNLDYNAKLKDDCLVDVTVAKKLYIEENLTQLKMRIQIHMVPVPDMYGLIKMMQFQSTMVRRYCIFQKE